MKKIDTVSKIITMLQKKDISCQVNDDGNIVTDSTDILTNIVSSYITDGKRVYNCAESYIYSFDDKEQELVCDVKRMSSVLLLAKHGIKNIINEHTVVFDSDYSASMFVLRLPNGADMEFE